jgi:hypothetical protein
MKHSSQPVQILKIVEKEGKTYLMVGLNAPKEELVKYQTSEGLFAVIKFFDSRRITAEQRKRIFATINDIADYIGDPRELTRDHLTSSFCMETGQDYFSLSDCSLETAREFISYIIEYVIANGIPLTDLGINRIEEIDKYLFQCLKHSKCCICGKEGISHKLMDKTKICFCNQHFDIAKVKGMNEFSKLYKVYGIKCSD